MRLVVLILTLLLPGCIFLLRNEPLEPLVARCQQLANPDPAIRRRVLDQIGTGWMARVSGRRLSPEEKAILAGCLRLIAPLLGDPDPDQRSTAIRLTLYSVAILGPREGDVVIPNVLRHAEALWASTRGSAHSADMDFRVMMALEDDATLLGKYGAEALTALPLLDAIAHEPSLARRANGEPPDRWHVERLLAAVSEAEKSIRMESGKPATPK